MSRGRTSGIRTESVLVHPRTGEEILLKRSSRRTLSVELRPDASLLVRAPLGVSEAGIFSFLEGQSAWIESRRKKLLERIESMPSDSLSDEEIRTLADEAMLDIPKRVRHFAPLVGVTYGRITIRNQKTRWGSCSAFCALLGPGRAGPAGLPGAGPLAQRERRSDHAENAEYIK